MTGEHVEVAVVMQDGDGGSDGDGCDEAIDEAPKGVAFPATAAKQGGRLVVVCGCRRKHGRTRKQAAQASQVVLVSGTGKHLHPDRITDRRSGPSQKLHPCRGVDQDHGLRLDRNSSISFVGRRRVAPGPPAGMQTLERFVSKRLRLRVNRDRSAVDRPWKRKSLRYSMTVEWAPRLKVAPESESRLRPKLKAEFTDQSQGTRPDNWTAARVRFP